MAGAEGTNTDPVTVSVSALTAALTALFCDAGLDAHAAHAVAEALVEADQQGIGSHGVAMAPMYIKRLSLGSISPASTAEIAQDKGATTVLDARHMFGQLAAAQAMEAAIAKARKFGVGVAAVRHGSHFGVAGRYAAQAALVGCVGFAMCNTRPMMAPPGGLEPVVGNNPLAIAVPTESGPPILLDMAMSEVALARVRAAALRGEDIPGHWAFGPDGEPTTSPAAALSGMLAPAAGAKGFALALLIDVLCGLLSSGATGESVRPLFDDLTAPNDCAFLFIAIDIAHFRALPDFLAAADGVRARINAAHMRNGASAKAPGERRAALARAQADFVAVNQTVLAQLISVADARGVDTSPLTSSSQT